MMGEKDDLKKLRIGAKIKKLRTDKDISLEKLAKKLGIQPIILSQIEQDVIPPTVATIVNLSRIFKVTPDFFLSEESSLEDVEIVRKDERYKIESAPIKVEPSMNYSFEALAYRLSGKSMEPFLVEVEFTESDPELLVHAGEEFWFVLSGELEFISKERRVRLKEGDSIYFFSNVPHGMKAIGEIKPKVLVVVLPERRG